MVIKTNVRQCCFDKHEKKSLHLVIKDVCAAIKIWDNEKKIASRFGCQKCEPHPCGLKNETNVTSRMVTSIRCLELRAGYF